MIRVELHPRPRSFISCDGPACTATAPEAPGTGHSATLVAVGLALSAGYTTILIGGRAGHLCRDCSRGGRQRGLGL